MESPSAVTSDVNYEEVGQTSQVEGIILYETALTPDISHRFGGPQATFTSHFSLLTSWIQI